MASAEAVQRRRANRAARTANKYARDRAREARDREIAVRMNIRFFPGQTADLMRMDIRYWQARRCGWDVLSDQLRTLGHRRDGSKIMVEAHQTDVWQWWSRQHPETRMTMVKESQFRLVNQQKISRRRTQLIDTATVA